MFIRASILVALSFASVTSAEVKDGPAHGEKPASASVVREAVASHEQASRPWKYLVVHHSATKGGTVEAIDREHRRRRDANGNPWRGIGYHFVIGNGVGMDDGKLQPTFRWTKQIEGAHAGSRTYNELGIGICLIGNFELGLPTEKQLQTLEELVSTLRGEYDLEANSVVAHGDIRATACPGKLFPRARFLLSERVADQVESSIAWNGEPACDDQAQLDVPQVASEPTSGFPTGGGESNKEVRR